jgi:hypothetical protein
MRIVKMLTASAALAVLAACGSGTGGQHQGSPGTGHAGSPDTQTAAIVACYRSHGDPGFPDPVYDPGDGRWHFGVSPASAPQSTRQACQHLFPSADASPPVPQAQFQGLVRLAQCLRQHGVPSWPDPDPVGAFPLPPSLLTKTPAYERAIQACQRYVPSGGLDVVAAS